MLLFGCCATLDNNGPLDPLGECVRQCGAIPHSSAAMVNGSCTCPCDEGYGKISGYCYPPDDYRILKRAECNTRCREGTQHSVGVLKAGGILNGTCRCACEKGYRAYNGTCMTPEEYDAVAPAACPQGYPVMKSYDWAYEGRAFYMSLCYENQTVGNSDTRRYRRDYWNFVSDPYSNQSVSLVTDRLMLVSDIEGFSQYERVEFAVAFVQGLPYTYDNVSTPYDEYPRFPWETIYADGGDCEDTTILLAAMLEKMGYDAVMLLLPHHMAAGVECDPSDFDYNVTYYESGGRKYCYIETTGEGWKVGVMPGEFEGGEVKVVALRGTRPEIYVGFGRARPLEFTYNYDRYDTYVDVTRVRVDNFGAATAKNVSILMALEKPGGGQWDSYTVKAGDIVPGGYYEAYATDLRAPTGQPFMVTVRVYGDNFDEALSKGGTVTWH